jgi:hypothetical protein
MINKKFINSNLIGRKIIKVSKRNLTIDKKKYSNVFVIHLDNGETLTPYSNKNNLHYLMVSNNQHKELNND